MSAQLTQIIVPAAVREYIDKTTYAGGELGAQYSSKDENLLVVTRVETAPNVRTKPRISRDYAALRDVSPGEVPGQWLTQVPAGTHVTHTQLLHRPGSAITFDDFSDMVPNVRAPRGHVLLLITHECDMPKEWLDAGVPEYAGWHLTDDAVTPVSIAFEPTEVGISQLDPQWPVAQLQQMRMGVVGVGSIGGVVVDALAGYGAGTLDLIDPDRFLWHNQVRHVLGPESVGMLKVDALADRIGRTWPETHVNAHPVNVVSAAHHMRAVFPRYDAVVCAADGIAARRVVSHLARRAHIPAVLACVLDDGAVGEVLRLRPGGRYGCLLCQRAALEAAGRMDLEVQQELDYGTGDPHRPMTAVGPDLWFIGHLAAKTAVATVLEQQHGDLGHRLPGELAVVGLRPSADTPQAPFDVTAAMDVRWSDIPAPREGCPTCAPAEHSPTTSAPPARRGKP